MELPYRIKLVRLKNAIDQWIYMDCPKCKWSNNVEELTENLFDAAYECRKHNKNLENNK